MSKNVGRLVGVDPIEKRTWNLTAKAHKLLMPRLLGCNASKVATRALLLQKLDGSVHPAPKDFAEFTEGRLLCVSAENNLAISTPGWTFRGFLSEAEGTSGKSFLFGLTPQKEVIDCPLSKDWIDAFVHYYEGGIEE